MNAVRTLLMLCVTAVAAPSPAAAQPACGTFALPFQGRVDGQAQLDTTIVIPPNQFNFYPIAMVYPAGALGVGLETWSHEVPEAVPPGAIRYVMYIDRNRDEIAYPSTGHPPGVGHDAVVVALFANDGQGVPHTQNLSVVLHPGEAVTVGAYSSYPLPVATELTMAGHVCFATKPELDDFLEYVETLRPEISG